MIATFISALTTLVGSTAVLAAPSDWDVRFNGQGRAFADRGSNYSETAAGIVGQSDGSIVVGTNVQASVLGSTAWVLRRYLWNGSIDGNFGIAGRAAIPVGLAYDVLREVATDNQQRIVVAGTSRYFGYDVLAVARVTKSGPLTQLSATLA